MIEIAAIGWKNLPWKFEALAFTDFSAFQYQPQERHQFSLLIILCPDRSEELISFLDSLNFSAHRTQIILVGVEKYKILKLQEIVNRFPVVSLLTSSEQDRTEDLLHAITLTRRLEEQELTRQSLLEEEESRQERQYQTLLNELNEQQKQIADIQTRLLTGLQQEKLLHDTLIIIMTSQGIGEIELKLQEILTPILGAVNIRIVLHQGSSHPQNWVAPAVSLELHEQDRPIGRLIVHPLINQSFSRRELKLLENISEALALHIPRLLAFEENASLEKEWRATFDAISDPLILVMENHQIIDANKAARARMGTDTIHGVPCYQLLFSRSKPCEFCQWGKKNNLEKSPQHVGEVWEMSSHSLSGKTAKDKIYVHLYRNKFEQIEMEKKMSAVAKATEVGIFKASLAHELNNPIGGLLTLAQLQKMDLPVDDPLYEIVEEIEQQALRCRDLIQDLLQKARPDSHSVTN